MKKVISITLAVLLVVVGMVSVNVTAAGAPTVTLCSASLSLKDSVYIWFDMFFENVDRDADDYGMIFWTAEQTSYTYEAAQGNAAAGVRDKAAGEWSHDSTLNRDVVTYKYGVAAKEMADVVYAQGYAKVGESYYYSSVVPYSVVKYASNKLGLTPGVTGTDDENLKTLLRNMLEYGAAAQIYFGYNTDNLANAILNGPVINEPALIVGSASAKAGETVKVAVEVKNNPGFLTMALQIDYDSTALTLTKISNGSDYTDYTFTPPRNKVSGCKAAWFATDLPEEIIDGEIMILQFKVVDGAASGRYAVTVSCPDDGSTLDGNKTAFTLADAVGYVTVN